MTHIRIWNAYAENELQTGDPDYAGDAVHHRASSTNPCWSETLKILFAKIIIPNFACFARVLIGIAGRFMVFKQLWVIFARRSARCSDEMHMGRFGYTRNHNQETWEQVSRSFSSTYMPFVKKTAAQKNKNRPPHIFTVLNFWLHMCTISVCGWT